MYYIYEIADFIQPDGSIGKIGVSEEPEKRVAKQGYSKHNILEEHTCIYEVSRREQELQRQYGYPVDRTPYWEMCQRALKGAASIPHQQLIEMNKLSPKGKVNRVLTYQQAEYIRAQYKRGKDVFGKKITYKRIANAMNIKYSVVWDIVKNRTYTTP